MSPANPDSDYSSARDSRTGLPISAEEVTRRLHDGMGNKPTRESVHKGTDGDERFGFTETETAALNSIEVTRNAKGDYQWSCKRYFRPDESWQEVLKWHGQVNAALRAIFCAPVQEFTEMQQKR